MRIGEALQQAARIVSNGWAQGHYADGDGGFCLRGAICLATGEMRVTADRMLVYATRDLNVSRFNRRVLDVVMDQVPSPFLSIPQFNDDPSTTRDDVLAVLDKALASVSR